MRRLALIAVLGSGALILSSCASAQYGRRPSGPYSANDPYSRNDPYSNRRGNTQYRGDLIGRVLSDLDRAERSSRGRSANDFEAARRDLLRFRQRWERGEFDRGRLDSAIGRMQRIVDRAPLAARDRDMLARDAYALRELRSTGGYNGSNGGYYGGRYPR